MNTQVRATNIKWSVDDNEDGSNLPNTVIIPDDIEDIEEISDWLSDEYGFCHDGYELEYLSNDSLMQEEELLKRAIYDAGVDAVEDFLGRELDDDNLDIWNAMDDTIVQMPDEEYVRYIEKYLKKS